MHTKILINTNSLILMVHRTSENTVVSRYYDTTGIRKKCHYIHTVEISSINFYCFILVRILIWYHSKQHFELSDIMLMRDYSMVWWLSFKLQRPTAALKPSLNLVCTISSFIICLSQFTSFAWSLKVHI